jgi:hypothetical protein
MVFSLSPFTALASLALSDTHTNNLHPLFSYASRCSEGVRRFRIWKRRVKREAGLNPALPPQR